MAICLTSSRMNMKADVLRQGAPVSPTVDPEHGEWVNSYDPDSNETIRVWKPFEVTPDDNDAVVGNNETNYSLNCIVRGVVDGGIRVAGTTERQGDFYENIDYARIWFPANKVLTKRDRITNVRNSKGMMLWVEEELGATDGVYRPTVFEVLGVTPILDPFGNHVENMALLERAQIQGNNA